MRLTLRTKLTALVGAAAVGFLFLTISGQLVARRVESKLTAIQEFFMPRMELGPRLEGEFERLHRGLQDAVAAHDEDALSETRALKDRLLLTLDSAGAAVIPAEGTALRGAIDDYYATAQEVSQRIISNESGESLVDAMALMQNKQAHVAKLIAKVSEFDRGELAEAFSDAVNAQRTAGRVGLLTSATCLIVVFLLSWTLSRGMLRSLSDLTSGFTRFAKSDFAATIHVYGDDELAEVAREANRMAESLRRLNAERERNDWIKEGIAGLVKELRGELSPTEVAERAARYLARRLDAPAAALYGVSQDGTARLLGHHALTKGGERSFGRGEGLVGQAALKDELTVITDVPASYLTIRSGLGEAPPQALALIPLAHAGAVTGVLELALFKPWSELFAELLTSIRETLAIALEVARARADAAELLLETQRQSQRLAQQEEELRVSNAELQEQQQELRVTNEELTNVASELEAQRKTLETSNAELEEAQTHLEQKAEELASVSAYKSQFLANMSHELRTPLNSMLLLSNLLAENETSRLSDKEVEYARTIHQAGSDLLALINQVLDLAKVEAGKQELHLEAVRLADVAERARRIFDPMARDKKIHFTVEIAPALPESLTTDPQRLDQILRNLLGNAFKFTQKGEVALRIRRSDAQGDKVAFVVSDTGPGIAPADRDRIFIPFEQVESASNRRFGGTGLGLTIAREMAALLGGELQLDSTLGQGSTFTCRLPWVTTNGAKKPPPARTEPGLLTLRPRDRGALTGPPLLLVFEDDPTFAEILRGIIQDQGLECVVAPDGETGLQLAKTHQPTGIILDVKLPDTDGWRVMEALRNDPATSAIPVHFVSGVDGAERGIALGAIGYLTKPASRRDLVQVVGSLAPKGPVQGTRLLIVGDASNAELLARQLAGEKLAAECATSAREALEKLGTGSFGCILLDLSLPDMDGLAFLESLPAQISGAMPSVLVYTGRPLSKPEAKKLEAYAQAVVLKEGASTERLLEEIRLFARRVKEGPGDARRNLPVPEVPGVDLSGKAVLVVDDDMRSVYALSALLRAKGAEVYVADTGAAAIALLDEHPHVEAVLMDIMMPEMDGYEAMRRIRKDARFTQVPIIALTAKAMKGDAEKCIEAGATGYLPKPIQADRLMAVLSSYLPARKA